MKSTKEKWFSCKLNYEDYIMLQRILFEDKISAAEFFRRQIREHGVESFFNLTYRRLDHAEKEIKMNQKILSILLSLLYENEPTTEMVERTKRFLKKMREKVLFGE